MSELLTHTQFEPLAGQTFEITLSPDRRVSLTLSEVETLPVHPARAGVLPPRTPFSLIFVGPKEIRLPQRMYPITHPALGTLEIFIVPIGPDKTGERYQAIFN